MASPGNPNTFTDNPLDRASHLRADPDWLRAAKCSARARFVALWRLRPLLRAAAGSAPSEIAWLDAAALAGCRVEDAVFLGRDEEHDYFALDATHLAQDEEDLPFRELGSYEDLMFALGRLDGVSASLLAQAKSMVDWHARHGFCARCGAVTHFADGGYRRDCPACEAQHFPRTDPVVISLVVREGRCLLGRNAMFRGPMFTALAGFLEPGETVEEAVAREVMEEVGVAVGEVRYLFTQPWPFPSSLMIGCIAQGLGEAITLDEKEIAEARWFTPEQLRQAIADSQDLDYRSMMSDPAGAGTPSFFVPPPSAIAHQLMLAWLAQV
ncbi:NAD(+) diphosphatase [Mangrovimicrobium sediminis]|uniref:NAD(+) diphosphatase n=1 Tax=Mangrovimicrobium sediminis TaxID=2562682 RepID=A0A4Z0M132_9GAMM|nr:NAD(+) diphosphatase [Haliea sp. SAOS-164]TGD73393.1 NAD(+) diphosphatase [Haliea sp. SAOS-164]